MPLYSFECGTCGRVVNEFRSVDERDAPPDRSCVCGARRFQRRLASPQIVVAGDLERSNPASHAAKMQHKKVTEDYVAKHGGPDQMAKLEFRGDPKYHPQFEKKVH